MQQKQIDILVGPNGGGKSLKLLKLANRSVRDRHRTLVIVNTPFNRFKSRKDKVKVLNISSRGINISFRENLASFFSDEHESKFDISYLLEIMGFESSVNLVIEWFRYDKGFDVDIQSQIILNTIPNISEEDSKRLATKISTLISQGTTNIELSNQTDSYQLSIMRDNSILFKYIHELKIKGKYIKNYSIFFKKRLRSKPLKKYIKFEKLSSGEQTLISTYMFIKNNINHTKRIIIDEPENSLHPEWQRRYLDFIYAAISYKDISISIATHSPIFVSGAVNTYGDLVDIFRVENADMHRVKIQAGQTTQSIEELLWKAFETITPANHYLSTEIHKIIHNLSNSTINIDEARQEIYKFNEHSFSDKQIEVLNTIQSNLEKFQPDASVTRE